MPYSLSNAGSSFCRLMEQCVGDQQFVTLLLYLDNICIFAPDVSMMLDQIKLVFSWLKSFNLKTSQRNAIFPGQCDFSGSYLISWWNICQPRNWLVPKNAQELHWFLVLTSYYCWFIPNFAHMAKCSHQLVGPTKVKKKMGKKKEVTTLGHQNGMKTFLSGHHNIKWHLMH